MVRHLSC